MSLARGVFLTDLPGKQPLGLPLATHPTPGTLTVSHTHWADKSAPQVTLSFNLLALAFHEWALQIWVMLWIQGSDHNCEPSKQLLWPTWFFFLCHPCMPFPTAQGKGQCKVSLAQQTYHLSSCVIVPSTASFWLTSIVRSGTTDSTQRERCDFLKTSIHCAALCSACTAAVHRLLSWMIHIQTRALKKIATVTHPVLAEKKTPASPSMGKEV